MKAGDTFTVVNSGQLSFDEVTFTKLYMPIIGTNAFALYQLFQVFSEGRISRFLEYLNMGLPPFIEALDKLSALNLVEVYDNHPDLYFKVKSPLSYEQFLADDLYKQLLISKIGENQLVEMAKTKEVKGQNISRKFHEVYTANFSLSPEPKELAEEKFNLPAFKNLMKDQKLTFADENQDSLALFSLAEKFELNWYQLFKKVEQTADSSGTINLQATMRLLTNQAEPVPALSTFPKAFQDLIISSKSAKPVEFLGKIKQQAGGFVSNEERKILTLLTAQNISDQVQNILIHYVLIQQKNPSLNANFVNTVANDWLRNKVVSAEQAVQRIMERNQLAAAKVEQNKFSAKPAGKVVKKAPEWSNTAYVNTTSDEERQRLEKIQSEMLKALGGE